MSKTTKEAAIHTAWRDLCHLADAKMDHTAQQLLDNAERAEARDARAAGVSCSKVEQLAGLCETALRNLAGVRSLYGMRDGHRDVAICVAEIQKRTKEIRAWRAKHGEAIRTFRAASFGNK